MPIQDNPDAPSVLLVDDDRMIVQAISVRLRAAGYRVISAFDGKTGLDLARARQPDAVVLDIRMAGMDGLTVLDRLQEQPQTQRIPVVMLSASVVDQKNALDRGAQFFLEKPYNADSLVAAIKAATGVMEAEA